MNTWSPAAAHANRAATRPATTRLWSGLRPQPSTGRGRGCRMATIAADAGVGVGTLYRHFPSRDDLLDHLTHVSFEQVLANAQAAERDGRRRPKRCAGSSRRRSASATSSCCRCTAGRR